VTEEHTNLNEAVQFSLPESTTVYQVQITFLLRSQYVSMSSHDLNFSIVRVILFPSLVSALHVSIVSERNISVYLLGKTLLQVDSECLPIRTSLNHVDLVIFDGLVPEDMTTRLKQHQVDLVGERCLRDAEDQATVLAIFIELHILLLVVLEESFISE
jgi:hypothetical protein